MTGFFKSTTRYKAAKLHRTIVEQLVDLTYKIAVLKKYMHTQDIYMQNSDQSMVGKLAEKFKDMHWDVDKYPFIVFNDCGTITPIYRNLSMVPKQIVKYQERIK